LCGVAAVTFASAHALRVPAPRLPLPWRVFIQVAALVVVFDSLFGALHLPTLAAASLVALLALALVSATAASMVNNLPASVAFATILASHGPTAYAHATVLAIALTGSAIVLKPLLGWAKLRCGARCAAGSPSRDTWTSRATSRA
jgi:hypothetical protein